MATTTCTEVENSVLRLKDVLSKLETRLEKDQDGTHVPESLQGLVRKCSPTSALLALIEFRRESFRSLASLCEKQESVVKAAIASGYIAYIGPDFTDSLSEAASSHAAAMARAHNKLVHALKGNISSPPEAVYSGSLSIPVGGARVVVRTFAAPFVGTLRVQTRVGSGAFVATNTYQYIAAVAHETAAQTAGVTIAPGDIMTGTGTILTAVNQFMQAASGVGYGTDASDLTVLDNVSYAIGDKLVLVGDASLVTARASCIIEFFTSDARETVNSNVIGMSALSVPIWTSEMYQNLPPIVPAPRPAPSSVGTHQQQDSLAAYVVRRLLDDPTLSTSSGWAETLQADWNHLMHAANGNGKIQDQCGLTDMLGGFPDEGEDQSPEVVYAPQRYAQPAYISPDDHPDWSMSDLLNAYGMQPTAKSTRSAPENKPSSNRKHMPYVSNPFVNVNGEKIEETLFQVLESKGLLSSAVRYCLHGEVVIDKNPYSPLDGADEDGRVFAEGVEPQVASRRSSEPGVRRAGGERKPKTDAPQNPPRPSLKNEVSKRLNREAVLDRLVTKLKKGGDDAVAGWMLEAQPERRFAYDVLSRLWGKNWQSSHSWIEWFCSWRLCPVITGSGALINKAVEMTGYTVFCSQLSALAETTGWAKWFELEFKTNWSETVSVFQGEADAHNQLMHAYNGNPVFAGSMTEVRQCPPASTLYTTARVEHGPKPWVTAIEVSTIASSINPVDQDVPTAMPLRGDVVTAANIVVNATETHALEACLCPRDVRNGPGAALINSTNRLAPFIFGTMSFDSSMLDDSPLMTTIVEAAIRANQNLGRADNTTLGGFQAFDVAYVGRTKSYYGLSMQSALAKLMALSLTTNLAQNRQFLPLSAEAGLYDPYTQLDPANLLTLAYNDSAIFGEGCGGNAAVLPFRGGATGTVYFHLTLQTVPEDSKSMAVFCPANLLISDPDPGQSIALFVMMWADWPTLMWTATVPTLDTAGGNPLDQFFIPHASNIFIPGMTSIHVVLPRDTTVANPRNQLDANNHCLVRPTTGPVASAGLAANAPINVNWVGGGLIGTNLAEYCYTWGQIIDSTTITQFCQRLNDLVAINQEVKHVHEKLAHSAIRYPPLVSQLPAGGAKLGVNSAAGWTQTSSLGVRATNTTADWPQAVIPRPDFLLFETDPVAWNKLVLQVAIVDGRLGDGHALTPLLGNPQSLYWVKLLARQQAVTTNVHLANMGWSAATWDTAYANTDMKSFRTIARGHYAGACLGSLRPQPAQLGKRLCSLFTSLLNYSPTPDLDGNTVFDYVVAPRSTRANIVTPAGVFLTNCCPIFLPDVWIHQSAHRINCGLSSWTPQNNEDSTTGLVDQDSRTIISGGGTLYGPMLRGSTPKNALRQIDTRDDTDAEIWNARLTLMTAPAAIMRDLAGNVIAASPAAGELPMSQVITPDYTMPGWSTGVRASSTFWLPRVLSSGVLQFPMDTRANMILTSRIQVGIARAAIEIWALNGLSANGDFKLGSDENPDSMWIRMLSQEPTTEVSEGGARAVEADSPASSTAVTASG
jgi:hypothetical protein